MLEFKVFKENIETPPFIVAVSHRANLSLVFRGNGKLIELLLIEAEFKNPAQIISASGPARILRNADSDLIYLHGLLPPNISAKNAQALILKYINFHKDLSLAVTLQKKTQRFKKTIQRFF